MQISYELCITCRTDATPKVQDASEPLRGSRWSGGEGLVGWAKQRIGGKYAGMIGTAAAVAGDCGRARGAVQELPGCRVWRWRWCARSGAGGRLSMLLGNSWVARRVASVSVAGARAAQNPIRRQVGPLPRPDVCLQYSGRGRTLRYPERDDAGRGDQRGRGGGR